MAINILRTNVSFSLTGMPHRGTYTFDADGLNNKYSPSMVDLMRKSPKAVNIIYAVKKANLKIHVFVNSSKLCKFFTPWEVGHWGLSGVYDDEALIAWDPTHSASKTVFWYDDYLTRVAPAEMANRAPTGTGVHVGTQDQTITLIHEFGHAFDYINDEGWYNNLVDRCWNHDDWDAMTRIEDHNVTQNEKPVAQDLGQGVRNYYKDRVV